jgi:hypothetical protein
MTRCAHRWTALLAWAAFTGIVWIIFVPRGLSVGTFTLLVLSGPVAVLTGSAVREARRPSPSGVRMRLGADVAASEAPMVRR